MAAHEQGKFWEMHDKLYANQGSLDRATYEKPATPSEGISYVLVNGVPVVSEGKIVEGVLPGRPVRAPFR